MQRNAAIGAGCHNVLTDSWMNIKEPKKFRFPPETQAREQFFFGHARKTKTKMVILKM